MRPFALSTTATCLLYQLLIQMSAAFDTVDHLLLDRLRIEFGVTEIPLTWLQSYLEGQTQFIKMAQHESHATEVDVGRGRRPTASIRARTSLVCGLLQPDHRRRLSPWRTVYHQYTDDTQLHLAMRADNTPAGLSVLADCTTDARQWYQNGLQLKPGQVRSSESPISCVR